MTHLCKSSWCDFYEEPETIDLVIGNVPQWFNARA